MKAFLNPSALALCRPRWVRFASMQAPQRKKVLTFQKFDSSVDPSESIIHPAFVTRKQQTTYLGKPVRPCVAVTACETFDLEKVSNIISLSGTAPLQIVPGECVTFKKTHNGKDVDIFVFKFGTVVAWNMEEKNVINDFLPLLEDAMSIKYSLQSEDLDYIDVAGDYSKNLESQSGITTDEIICLFGDNQNKLLDKLAFSYGISRSTRLAILEKAIEDHISLTKNTIIKLSAGENLAVDSNEVLKLSGRLLLLRGKLNLYSELVETPDIYWSESRLEKLHNKISNELDVSLRITNLNRKLDYLSEEAQALIGIMTKRSETNLELIIIYLITIEVIFELYHFYDRLGGKYNMDYFKELFTGDLSAKESA
ncbi:Mrx10 protein [Martiniozyma asiatica (nom. inval.)]|nr:Mrx10 protein [Martiniozyma asiatica]